MPAAGVGFDVTFALHAVVLLASNCHGQCHALSLSFGQFSYLPPHDPSHSSHALSHIDEESRGDLEMPLLPGHGAGAGAGDNTCSINSHFSTHSASIRSQAARSLVRY